MKKIILLFSSLICFSFFSNAQTIVTIDAPLYGTSGNVVTGTSNYAASEAIYFDSEIGSNNFTTAATAINRIEFSVNAIGTVTTFSSFRVYMQNIPASITTFAQGTYSTAGYTMVYNGSISITTTGWVGVNLTTPFIRNAGDNLQILIERADGVAHSNFSFNCVNEQSAPLNTRRYNGASALSGSTVLATSLFRASVRLKNVVTNDLSIDKIETFGKISKNYGTPFSIKTTITNQGSNAKPAGTVVNLSISGANTFTDSKTITSSLAPGASKTITFNPVTSLSSIGDNTITVYLTSTDPNASNDTLQVNQEVTENEFAYADTSVAVSSIGYNTGEGFLLCKYKFTSAINLTGVRTFIRTKNNVLYGVACNSVGQIIGQTPDYTIQVADSNTYVTFNFTTPISIGKDSVFFIGIAQKAGSYGYFPMGSQKEVPARDSVFAGISGLAGGTISYYNTLGRFMIEGIAEKSLPLTLAYFNGRIIQNKAELTWATLTETNTNLFEVERLDNISDRWNTITTIKANGNSSSLKNYVAYDYNLKEGKYQYRLKMIDKDGSFTYSPIIVLEINNKNSFVLHQNYPNPIKNSTQISYQLPTEGKVLIEIFNQEGKRIATPLNQYHSAGTYNIQLNTTQLKLVSGIYQYKMTVINSNNQVLYTNSKTMMIVP